MKEVTNIVLTGGSCAGKTTALVKITQYFTYRGFVVYTQPEAATLFNQGGVNFLTNDKEILFESEKQLLSFQLHTEECFRKMAENSANPDKRTIHKLRRCFVWDNRYLELDTFVEPPLPHHLPEIEDVAADEPIVFPTFLKVLREVTDDPEWYNANIAKRHE